VSGPQAMSSTAAGIDTGIAMPAAQDQKPKDSPKNYRGFVAGIFSGVAKVSVGHPFDTVKVRLQTASRLHFAGPLDCVQQTLRHEGFRGLYKGATPPLLGWMFMDSLLMGSLTFYRRMLKENVFTPQNVALWGSNSSLTAPKLARLVERKPGELPAWGHGIAGVMAGCTVCTEWSPRWSVLNGLGQPHCCAGGAGQGTIAGAIRCRQEQEAVYWPH